MANPTESLEAILAYGYDLGGIEDFKAAERDESGRPKLSWFDEGNRDYDPDDFPGIAMHRLLKLSGFTEPYSTEREYSRRLHAAIEALGVEFLISGSVDFPGWVLGAYDSDYSATYGETMAPLEVISDAGDPVANGWDAKLTAALIALGITPTQRKPAWLMFPFYGGGE